MALYTVYAPPPGPGETAPDPVRFVFVKEGFCWPALFIPELWLLFRRMWLVFLLYVAASVALSVVGERVGGPLPWVALILMHLLFALEGNGLRRWKLAARGYEFVGVAEGRLPVAELRFFSQWQPRAVAVAPAAPPPAAAESPPASTDTGAPRPWTPPAETRPAEPAPGPAATSDVVGLFPTPGGAT